MKRVLLSRDPVLATRDEINGVVDRPEQSFDCAPAAPALLVAQYHCLYDKPSAVLSLRFKLHTRLLRAKIALVMCK